MPIITRKFITKHESVYSHILAERGSVQEEKWSRDRDELINAVYVTVDDYQEMEKELKRIKNPTIDHANSLINRYKQREYRKPSGVIAYVGRIEGRGLKFRKSSLVERIDPPFEI
jgi:hypothetical protein